MILKGFTDMWKRFYDWCAANKGLFWGIVIGLAIAILFLTIGFWRTLLIAVCAGIGAFLGTHENVRKAISMFFENLFTRKKS